MSAIECHLIPKWAGREIEGVTHEELQKWVDSFDLPGAAEKAFKTFRQVYRWALRRYQLRVWDVTQGVELMFKTDDEDAFTETVLQPSTTTNVSASCAKWNSHSELYVKAKTFTISGRSVSTAKDRGTGNYMCGQRNLTSGQQTFGDFIAIVKVIGWR